MCGINVREMKPLKTFPRDIYKCGIHEALDKISPLHKLLKNLIIILIIIITIIHR